jgi:hypothetical protein
MTATYGVPTMTLTEARHAVERALGVAMAEHDSLYLGGAYYRWEKADARVIVRQNLDLLDMVREEEVDDQVLLEVYDGSPDRAVLVLIESELPFLKKIREHSPSDARR